MEIINYSSQKKEVINMYDEHNRPKPTPPPKPPSPPIKKP